MGSGRKGNLSNPRFMNCDSVSVRTIRDPPPVGDRVGPRIVAVLLERFREDLI